MRPIFLGVLAVGLPGIPRIRGGALDVELGGLRDEVRRPPDRKRAAMNSGHGRRAHAVHALDERLEVAARAGVAAGLQQIGADGHRHEPERHGVGEIAAVDPAGERDREAVAELAPEPADQVHRQHVQRRAGQVHLFLIRGKERPVVLDDQRVGELHAESETERRRRDAQPLHECGRLFPRRVALERARGDTDVVVPQHVVQQPPCLGGPSSIGFSLTVTCRPTSRSRNSTICSISPTDSRGTC